MSFTWSMALSKDKQALINFIFYLPFNIEHDIPISGFLFYLLLLWIFFQKNWKRKNPTSSESEITHSDHRDEIWKDNNRETKHFMT